MKQKIMERFGEVSEFERQFEKEALEFFGSGWLWLIESHDKLQFMLAENAATPVALPDPFVKPLLVLDIWEHAYFDDYETDRRAYIENFLSQINWSFVDYVDTLNFETIKFKI